MRPTRAMCDLVQRPARVNACGPALPAGQIKAILLATNPLKTYRALVAAYSAVVTAAGKVGRCSRGLFWAFASHAVLTTTKQRAVLVANPALLPANLPCPSEPQGAAHQVQDRLTRR